MLVKMAELYPRSQAQKVALVDAMAQVMGSGRYIGGKWVTTFEEEWADYCGAKYCVGVSSGFAALQLALRAVSIPDVRYPTMTCMPTVLAIEEAGCSPMPVVPSEDHYVLEHFHMLPNCVNVYVALYGVINPDIIETDGVAIVEDNAQAHGRLYKAYGRANKVTASTWSFYPTKNLGAMGDAGAVTTNDEGLARVVRALSNYEGRGSINARLDPLQAAVLWAKLPDLDQQNLRRAANAELYLTGLNGYPLELPDYGHDVTNWHQFPVRLKDRNERTNLQCWLYDHSVESQVHYDRPALTKMRKPTEHLEWDVRWAATVLSLPVGPHLSESDIHFVMEVIDAFYQKS